MADDHKHEHNHDHKHEPGRSTVAIFGSRAEAREAMAALHKAHFTHTWLGTTSMAQADGGAETLTVESAQSGGFFGGTGSLVDALVSHGVLGDTARQVEATVEPGDALLTLDPKDKDLSEALSIIEAHGGRIGGRTYATPFARTARTSLGMEYPAESDYAEETFYRRTAVPH